MLIKGLDFSLCGNLEDWDRKILDMGFPHPWQSSAYGEYLKSKGNSVQYLDLVYDDRRIGNCLISISPRNIAQCLYGPLVIKNCHLSFEKVVSELFNYLRKLGVISLNSMTTPVAFEKGYYYLGQSKNHEIFDAPLVDLELDIETIYRFFHPSVRKNVRKCKEAGVEVLITNDPKYLPVYTEMLVSHRKRLDFLLPPFYPNPDSFRFFNSSHTALDIAMAFVDNQYLCGLGFVTFGKIVVEVAVAQSALYETLNLPAHDFIKARAIEYYSKKGIKFYDIAGVKRFPKAKKEENIKRFKLKFCTNTAEFNVFSNIVFNPVGYFIYRLQNKLEEFIPVKNVA